MANGEFSPDRPTETLITATVPRTPERYTSLAIAQVDFLPTPEGLHDD